MIFTLITGFVVAVFFAQASPFITDALKRASLTLTETQMSLFCFALCLALAAALLNLMGVHSYPVMLCIGAALGVARKPILARLTSRGD